MLATRPETVTRAIRSLRDDGLAFFEGRRVIVTDLDALLDAAELP